MTPSDIEKTLSDAMFHGTGVMKDGKYIPLNTFYLDPLDAEIARLSERLAKAEAERDAAVAALTGYRAAVAYVASDSWDGCSDCIEVLRQAACADDGRTVSSDQLAADLQKLRLTARDFDKAEGERRATAAIVAWHEQQQAWHNKHDDGLSGFGYMALAHEESAAAIRDGDHLTEAKPQEGNK